MKALRFRRSVPRFAAARIAGSLAPGGGARVGPLGLYEGPDPDPPDGDGWHRVRPRLAGICGSDLATVGGRSSRYFEPIVSFPFVPGHEIVGTLDDGSRVVLEPVLGCAARRIEPPCPACAGGSRGRCEHISVGHLKPGLQTGYCADTGGGWSTVLYAHESQIHRVPEALADDAAVMVEPAACAVHAVLRAAVPEGGVVAVLGAGTLGLCVTAALRRFSLPGTVIVGAKHPEQKAEARRLGADVAVVPGEIARAVRRATRSLTVGGRLSGGADAVIDCVGSAASLAQALAVTRPGGRVTLVGMPGPERVDLAPLWQREIELVGAYAYGTEEDAAGRRVRTFDLAFDLAEAAGLERLVSARYPLERYREAIEHAAAAGGRGATKIVFEPKERSR
ncbi:MAG TPA: zinc-binding dehydrogenase [Acidimicrobiia bacterium]|nr:zinc-binding dehydrogenase [Acidimicrobiia bacterium]